jgi:hypothetical protein
MSHIHHRAFVFNLYFIFVAAGFLLSLHRCFYRSTQSEKKARRDQTPHHPQW